jgi:hypothetical protein
MNLNNLLNSFDKKYHSIVLSYIDKGIYNKRIIKNLIKQYEKINFQQKVEKKLINKGYYDLDVLGNYDIYYKNFNTHKKEIIRKSKSRQHKEKVLLSYEKRR